MTPGAFQIDSAPFAATARPRRHRRDNRSPHRGASLREGPHPPPRLAAPCPVTQPHPRRAPNPAQPPSPTQGGAPRTRPISAPPQHAKTEKPKPSPPHAPPRVDPPKPRVKPATKADKVPDAAKSFHERVPKWAKEAAGGEKARRPPVLSLARAHPPR